MKLAGSLLALLLLSLSTASAAIVFGPSGTSPQTFDTRPAASEWSTLNIAGGGATYADTQDGINTAVAALAASSITTQVGSSASAPPTTATIARWNSTYQAIQTKPSGNAGIALMATLVNNSGLSVTNLGIRYHQATYDTAADFLGYGVYYSLTGAAASWQPIPGLSGVASGDLEATVDLSANLWTAGSTLYLLWFDDNNNGNTDPSYVIDNFEAFFGGPPQCPEVTTQPPATTTITQCMTLRLSVAARGTPPLTYQWYKEGVAIGTDPFWGGNPTATNATLVISNVSGADTAESYGYNCQVQNVCGSGWSEYGKVTVINDELGPRLLSAFGPGTNLLQIVMTFDEAILEADATSVFNYGVWDEFGAELGKSAATLDASGKIVTLELDPMNPRVPGVRYTVYIGLNSLHDRCQGYGNLDMNVAVNVEVPLLTLDDGTTWRYNQDGQDQGVNWRAAGFNDSGWAGGQAVLDAYNPSRETVSSQIVRTPLSLTNPSWGGGTNNLPTYYFRAHFNFPADPAGPVRLKLIPFIDDGAIFYINGYEVARYFINPGLPVPFDSYINTGGLATGANAIGTANFTTAIYVPLDHVVQGDNVIAVELKQWNATSSDATMGVVVIGEIPPVPCTPAQITTQPAPETVNEGQTARFSVAASGTDLRYQWYKNGSLIPDATNVSYSIANANCTHAGSYLVHVWNSCTSPEKVSSAATLTVNANTTAPTVLNSYGDANLINVTVNFTTARPLNTNDLQNVANYVFTPSVTVLSAVVNNGTNVVLTTNPRTAGTRYTLTVQNIHDTSCTPLLIAPYVNQTLVSQVKLMSFTDNWKYDDSGTDLGTTWKDVGYTESWRSGPGILGFETTAATLTFLTNTAPPNGVNTPLVLSNGTPHVATYYFRATFNNPISSGLEDVSLSVRGYIDDGAVMYLNGTEFTRINMTNIPITYATLALRAATEAQLVTANNVGTGLLVPGQNLIAVEVHQEGLTSSDIDFGMELFANIGAAVSRVKIVHNDNGSVTLTWTDSAAQLFVADAPTGPWTRVSGNPPSGYTFTPPAGAATKFYRVCQGCP